MKSLKSVVRYECVTSFKYIWIFYSIQYACVGLITVLIGIIMGGFEHIGTNVLEMNTFVYICVLGVLGFQEDFKMLIQNGFTRKNIYIATLSMFCFISGIMAFVDTLVGNVLHYFNKNYTSLYGGIYGYGNIFMNWLWLFLFYVLVCCLMYLVILVINKLGKTASVYLGVCLGCMVLLIAALFRYVFSAVTVSNISKFLMKAMGIMADGTINCLFPALSLFIAAAVLGIGAYSVIRRTELK